MRCLLLLFLSVSLSVSFGQSNDAALNKRLAAYLEANRKLDFESLMNFIHPKLFKVASKEAMVEGLRQSFNNDKMQIQLDSMEITQVGPVFAYGTTAYRKVDYFMVMDVQFTEKEKLGDSTFVKLMEKNFARVFRGSAAYNAGTETFHVRGNQFMLAIKDAGQPWMFIGHKADKALNEFLFPKAVISKFNLLKE